MLRLTATAGILLATLCCTAQKKPTTKVAAYKFEKIDATALSTKLYSLDSSAQAVMLADVVSTYINGNNKGGFTLTFKRKARIHILSKSAYDEATIKIPLYTSGTSTETIDDIKGVTYNLDGATVTETKLTKENIFTEAYSRNIAVKKFTLPAVKEGSIVDFEYTVKSDFLFNLQPWTFQRSIPTLWSEYTLALPSFLDYVFLSQGFLPFTFHTQKETSAMFTMTDNRGTGSTERGSFTANVMEHRWGIENVPKLKEESYTSSLKNYYSKLEFQLAAIKEPFTFKSYMNTWPKLTEELLNDEDFGQKLHTANLWLNDDMREILSGNENELQKSRKI